MFKDPLPGKKNIDQLKLLNSVSALLFNPEAPIIHPEQEVIDLIQATFQNLQVSFWSVGPNHSCILKAYAPKRDLDFEPLQTLLKEVLQTRILQTRKGCIRNASASQSHARQVRSLLYSPVIQGGSVHGVICLESDQKYVFDESDLLTLEGITTQLSRQAYQKKNLSPPTIAPSAPSISKELDFIGQSPAFLQTLSLVDKIAPTLVTVLIQGESGTGKELIARRLHQKSQRPQGPYVTINCGALQESLLESELFGHEKGAFTGALTQKLGLCEVAHGGTLFLDEIGEMSFSIQAKLLRFLQEGEFYRVGGKRPIRVTARVISATHRDLEQEVRKGRFREDLYYRLNTILLQVPPLRKRKEDIPVLARYFLNSSRFGGNTPPIQRIDPRVWEAFQNYHWPGNIRELQNLMERLKILAENQEIRLHDLPPSIRMPHFSGASTDHEFEMSLEEVEKKHILRTLAYNHGNKTRTAQSLGITIKTLYNKLHRYGILQLPPSKAPRPANQLMSIFEN